MLSCLPSKSPLQIAAIVTFWLINVPPLLALASPHNPPYIFLNSGVLVSTPNAPPESFTGRAPVFLCQN